MSAPPVRHASLIVNRLGDDRPFAPGAGPNNGRFFLPWSQLRDHFAREGIALHTRDVNAARQHPVAFELHLNAQRQVPHALSYAYLYEDPIVRPLNADAAALARYRRVFTSNETLINGDRIQRLDYPNDLALRDVPGWAGRDLFCVLIASNKALLHPHPQNLHHQRVAAIRHFEAHAPDRFALYGHGWDIPAVQPGALGRVKKRLHEWRRRFLGGPPPFPSYCGKVAEKSDVLDRARFAICYENSSGSPGYITEKIFDCFTSGCVPVYIGTTHAAPPVPSDCFIDGDGPLRDPRRLLDALDAVTPERFGQYQAAMRTFLQSPAAGRFTNDHWCRTLVQGICSDLQGNDSASAFSRKDCPPQ